MENLDERMNAAPGIEPVQQVNPEEQMIVAREVLSRNAVGQQIPGRNQALIKRLDQTSVKLDELGREVRALTESVRRSRTKYEQNMAALSQYVQDCCAQILDRIGPKLPPTPPPSPPPPPM